MGIHKDGKQRTIIIKLLNYKDKVEIMKNAKNLKDTGIYINEDYSNETMAIRKELWSKVKQLRLEGKFAVIKYDRIYWREKRYVCLFVCILASVLVCKINPQNSVCQIQQEITILKINVLTLLKGTVFF